MAEDRPPPPSAGPVRDPWTPTEPGATAAPAEPAEPAPAAPTGWGPPTTPTRMLPRRPPRWLVVVAAATAAASVASFLTVLLWPGADGAGPADPNEFHGLTWTARIGFDAPSNTTLTAVSGAQGYAAWEADGDLQVVAFEVPTGRLRWRREVGGGGASQWSRLLATPEALYVLAHEPDPTEPRRMSVRDAATGQERWHEDVRGDDELFLLPGTFVWLDHEEEALRGLDPATGEERWRRTFPDAEASSRALRVLTGPDLAGPSTWSGAPDPAIVDDRDSRIVMVDPDRSVSVIDAGDGATISEAGNVAAPGDWLLAYGDRLFVASHEREFQLLAYDLAGLSGVPQLLYSARHPDRYPADLEPCGGGQVCLLEEAPIDRSRTELVAVDAVDGGARWRAPAPEAEQVLAVGEWVVATASVDFDPSMTLVDAAGEQVFAGPGRAVRLDGANLLIFSTGSPDSPAVAGVAIVQPEPGAPVTPVALGRLPADMRPARCSWTDRQLVCPDREGADVWQFADG